MRLDRSHILIPITTKIQNYINFRPDAVMFSYVLATMLQVIMAIFEKEIIIDIDLVKANFEQLLTSSQNPKFGNQRLTNKGEHERIFFI